MRGAWPPPGAGWDWQGVLCSAARWGHPKPRAQLPQILTEALSRGQGRDREGGAAQRKQASRGGAAGPHKGSHSSPGQPASRAARPHPGRPLGCGRARRPLKGAFSSLTALSHTGLTQQLGKRPLSRQNWQPRAPSWGIKPPLVSPDTEARAVPGRSPRWEGAVPQRAAHGGKLEASAASRRQRLPKGRDGPPESLPCGVSLCLQLSPEERLLARQLCKRSGQQPLPWTVYPLSS